MTVRSIASDGAGDYATYLESKTVAPERGDYYLGPDGEPAETPGRWLASSEALAAVGVDAAAAVGKAELVALMQGTRPGTGEVLRRSGAGGARNAGVDVTLSAPKSVSVAWALSGPEGRARLEAAHEQAVERTFAFLRDEVPLTTQWNAETKKSEPAIAKDLLGAAFRHSTARGLAGRVPDPQLHSHLVVTSVLKQDGQVAAVRDRSMYRAAREGGAFYRAALAEDLVKAGYRVKAQTGKHGRYFELAGISPQAREAFSGRSKEIERAVREFEAREGRLPVEGELQLIKLDTRQDKLPHTQSELRDSWVATAKEQQLHPAQVEQLARRGGRFEDVDPEWGGRVERGLTIERATFTARELRAVGLEQAAGTLAPESALRRQAQLADAGRVVELEDGRWTTRTLRQMEASMAKRAARMATTPHTTAGVPRRAVQAAVDQVAERIGGPLSAEQQQAVSTLLGPGQLVALEGQAGTGKGVVIDTLARAERISGRQVRGVALAGATAQRLGEDSPALAGRTTTIASLLAQHSRDGEAVDAQTTVIVDEAGMIDTPTLEALVRVCDTAGAKLVCVGDTRQLPAIGPGGMFDQLTFRAPRAELGEVRRTPDREEQQAWRALRMGRAEQAMAHYLAREQLHLTDDRAGALQEAVARYDVLAQQHGPDRVALMSDGATSEIDRMNARAQQLRLGRGELGERELALPEELELPYTLREGDLVTWRQIQTVPGDARVENGSRGRLTSVDPSAGSARVELLGSGREVLVAEPEQLGGLRLAYAQHVVRQQGATVDRAVAVTGGWQTGRESAYVQASRARQGVDFYAAREELGEDGTDPERITRLAERMSKSRAKQASITQPVLTPPPGRVLDPSLDPGPMPLLPSPDPGPAGPGVER